MQCPCDSARRLCHDHHHPEVGYNFRTDPSAKLAHRAKRYNKVKMMGRGFGNGGPVGEGRRERRNLARKLDLTRFNKI